MDWLGSLAPLMRGVAEKCAARNDVEDVVQDAYIKLLNYARGNDFRDDDHRAAVATKMVKQAAIDRQRGELRGKRDQRRTLSYSTGNVIFGSDGSTGNYVCEPEDCARTPCDVISGSEVIRAVRTAVEGLGESWRGVVSDYLFSDSTPSSESDRGKLYRGKKELQRILSESKAFRDVSGV